MTLHFLLIAVHLSPDALELYQRMQAQARAHHQRYAANGPAHVQQALHAILWLLAPLRAICAGGPLRECAAPRVGYRGLMPGGGTCEPAEECPGCLEAMEQPMMLPCRHWACR